MKQVRYLLLLLLLLVALAACGGDEEADDELGEEQNENLLEAEETYEEEETVLGESEALDEAVEPLEGEALEEEAPLVAGGQPAGQPFLIRMSFLSDLDVQTTAGEEIGEVVDAYADPDGTVAYLLFDPGEFYEMGADRLALLPWDMFYYVETPLEGRRLAYQGDPALVESALLDAALFAQDDRYLYGDEGSLPIGNDMRSFIQLSDYHLFNFTDQGGDELGAVEELIIDLEAGQVAYLMTEVGGLLGLGEKIVAVPWSALSVDEETATLILTADRASLENAPDVELDQWDYGPPPDWQDGWQ